MGVSLTKQQGRTAHTQPAHTTLTTSMHNPPIMVSSSSASNWEFGASAPSNKGGKYCTMCATPRPKHQAVLAALAADVAAPNAVVAAPTAVAKAIPSAPTPGSVIGVSAAAIAAHAAAVSIAVATATVSLLLKRILINVCAPRHCCCHRCLCHRPLSLLPPPPQSPPS